MAVKIDNRKLALNFDFFVRNHKLISRTVL